MTLVAAWAIATIVACSAAEPIDTAAPDDPASPTAAAPGEGDGNLTADAGVVVPGEVEPAPTEQGDPGTVIATTSIDAPSGGRAWRFSYRSTDSTGRGIAVTGVFLAPARPPPDGGFPLVSWAHPTTGSADGCQPSTRGIATLPFTGALLERGWAIVATDYEGLGSVGAHPYLVGSSGGRSVLDAARAASRLPDSGVEASSPVLIWGFSQGGHAGAFAAQLAPTYAPELDLVGVALAAPVSDVVDFTRRAEGMEDQLGVVLTVVNGFRAAYPELDPATVLTPEGVAALDEVERRCIGEINEHADRPVTEIMAIAPTSDPAFGDRFEQNRAGDSPVGVPVLIVQGDDDDIVNPAATTELVDRYCAQGAKVQYVRRPGVNHAVLAESPSLDWMAERLAGTEAPSTC